MLLITGASGFLGSTLANLAQSRQMPVRGLARQNSDLTRLHLSRSEIAIGDMTDPESLNQAAAGASAVIHCAATTSAGKPDWELSRRVNIEGTRNLIAACQRAGVERLIQISSQSAQENNPGAYGKSKHQADVLVRESNLQWTLLKPGLIYGPGRSGVFEKVVGFTQKFPIVPILGTGRHQQRPVHVEDVAWAALACLETPNSIGREYDLGGAEPLDFNDMIRAILAEHGQSKPLIHLPLWLCMLLARVLGLLSADPPVTVDNVLGVRLAPDIDNRPAEQDLGFQPRSFQEGLRGLFGGEAQSK